MQTGLPDPGRNPEFACIYHGESTPITMKLQTSLWGFQSSGGSFPQSSTGDVFQLITMTCIEATLRKKKGKNEMGGRKSSLVAWPGNPYVFSCSINCAYTLDFG